MGIKRGQIVSFVTGFGRRSPLHDVGKLTDGKPPEILSPEHKDMVLRGLEAVRAGDIASDEEVRDTFARYRL